MSPQTHDQRLNTTLQRQLLKRHAEEARAKGMWLRFQAQPEFKLTPDHFMELVDQGRFETTSPTEWEMFTQEKANEAQAVTVDRLALHQALEEQMTTTTTTASAPAPAAEKKPHWKTVEKAKRLAAQQGAAAPAGTLEQVMFNKLQERKQVSKEIEGIQMQLAKTQERRDRLSGEILQLASQMASGAPSTTPTAAAIPLPTPSAAPGKKMNGHPRRGRYRANGIRMAIFNAILDQGTPVTTTQIQRAVFPQFHQDKVRRNLVGLVGERILARVGDDNDTFTWGPKHTGSVSYQKVLAERTQAKA